MMKKKKLVPIVLVVIALAMTPFLLLQKVGTAERQHGPNERRGGAVTPLQMGNGSMFVGKKQSVRDVVAPTRKTKKRSHQVQVELTSVPQVAGSRTADDFSRHTKSRGDSAFKFAHVVVVGNQKYVDGALAMGWTLAKYRQHDVELICMVSTGQVSKDGQDRLWRVGWDRVVEVPSLSHEVPKAFWKDSFVKLHIFNLTRYQKVAYWDSDMLVVQNPNAIFDIDTHLNEEKWLVAVGNPPSAKNGPYFQTGMMLFHPTQPLRDGIWEAFKKGKKGKYNTNSARDGMLLRDYFGINYSLLPKKFSRNLDPRKGADGIVGLHFRGGWKPWNDRRKAVVKRLSSDEDTKKDFGHAYLLWWQANEQLQVHLGKAEVWDTDEVPEDIICTRNSVKRRVSPTTHVWMLRETKESYFQPLSFEALCRRNVSLAELSLSLSPVGQSCTETCNAYSLECHEPSLSTNLVNDCAVMHSLFSEGKPCSCDPSIYTKTRDGTAYPGIVHGHLYKPDEKSHDELHCVYNLLLDERGTPSCAAKHDAIRRVCPCAPVESTGNMLPWDGKLPVLLQ